MAGEYLVTLEVYQYAPRTIESYTPLLRDLSEFMDRLGIEPRDVDYLIAEKWLLSLQKRQYKGSTLRKHVAAARSFWCELQRKRVVDYNPFRDLRPIRYETPLPEPLSEEQITALIDGEPFPLRKAMWECFYGTGFRISSVRTIERAHLDLSAGTIRALKKGGKWQVQNVTSKMREAFEAHLKYAPESKWLFQSYRVSQPLDDATIRKYLREAALRVGITRDVRPHQLRHSVATHLLDRGADLRHIQEFMAHKTILSTQIYTQVSKAKLKKVVEDCHPRA